jgi:hypothetical protein
VHHTKLRYGCLSSGLSCSTKLPLFSLVALIILTSDSCIYLYVITLISTETRLVIRLRNFGTVNPETILSGVSIAPSGR